MLEKFSNVDQIKKKILGVFWHVKRPETSLASVLTKGKRL